MAAALAVNFFLAADYAVEGFNLAESYMLPLSAGAAWCYLRAQRAQGSGLLLLCGVFLGLALVLKQTMLPLGLAVLVHWTGWCLGDGSPGQPSGPDSHTGALRQFCVWRERYENYVLYRPQFGVSYSAKQPRDSSVPSRRELGGIWRTGSLR